MPKLERVNRMEMREKAQAWQREWPVGSKGILKKWGAELSVEVTANSTERGWPLLSLSTSYGERFLMYSERKKLRKEC